MEEAMKGGRKDVRVAMTRAHLLTSELGHALIEMSELRAVGINLLPHCDEPIDYLSAHLIVIAFSAARIRSQTWLIL